MKELINIQAQLKAPKGQRNNFGKYNYRSCEDILMALKSLLSENKCFLTLSDKIVNIGNRNYVEATATLYGGNDVISVTASACESEVKKGMDSAQITGAASSYARKYALNGLFAIDDTKDADATNQHGAAPAKPQYKQPAPVQAAPAVITPAQVKRLMTIANGVPVDQVKAVIKHHGFTSSKDITTFAYTQICLDVEALKK